MIRQALLLSSSRQPYRRGGLVIGPKHAPTKVTHDDGIEPEALLAILRDPAIALAEEVGEEGVVQVRRVDNLMRAEAIEVLAAAVTAKNAGPDNAEVVARAEELLAGFQKLTPDGAAQVDGPASIEPGSEAAASSPVEPNTTSEDGPPAGAETAAPAATDGDASTAPKVAAPTPAKSGRRGNADKVAPQKA